jgi:hypothetical protein
MEHGFGSLKTSLHFRGGNNVIQLLVTISLVDIYIHM